MQSLRELDAITVRRGIAGLIVAAILVVLGVVLLGGDGSSNHSPGEPVALSESKLLARAKSFSHPAFWFGPRPGTTSYELTSTPDGRIYIRYLTGGAEAGDTRPRFLTVATYRVPNAKQALLTARKSSNGAETLSRHDGYEVLSGSSANNVYVVFDNEPELQIEIFSPQPGEAADLATSGLLRPLASSPRHS